MRFADPQLLPLLLLVPLAVGLLQWRARPAAIGFPSSSALRQLPPSLAVRLHRALPWLRALVLGLAVLALARPEWGVETTTIRRQGVAIALVIDTSSSMSAIDLKQGDHPANRLDVVKATLSDFITGRDVAGGDGTAGDRGGDAIAMVAFARYADTISPPTLDHAALLGLLDQVQIVERSTEDGTAIGDAIVRATDLLDQAQGASKVIVLLTDGSFNAGEAEPLEAAQIAAAYGITIHTIGAGSRGTALVPVDAGDEGEARYLSSPVTIDEQTLQQIAELTGGRYFRATDAQTLRSIYAEIDRLAKAPNVALHQQRYVELYPLIVALALSLLVLEMVLVNTRLRTVP
jgi:Ca-activated chloride channel family protein